MNPYSHKIPRKTASRLLLFITLLIISLQVPAQETDEYGWRKSDTQVIGHYSGGNKAIHAKINEKSATVPKRLVADFFIKIRLVFLQNLAMPGTYVHFSIDFLVLFIILRTFAGSDIFT